MYHCTAKMDVEGEDGGEGEEIKEETQMEENKGRAYLMGFRNHLIFSMNKNAYRP